MQRGSSHYLFILLTIFFLVYFGFSQRESIEGFLNEQNQAFPSDDLTKIQESYQELVELNKQALTQVVVEGDIDEDGLSNKLEVLLGSDLANQDTDGDSTNDYEEFLAFTDPVDFLNAQALSPQYIERRVQLLAEAGIPNAEQLASTYYLARLTQAIENEDLVNAEQQLAFAFQYRKDASLFLEQLQIAYKTEALTTALVLAEGYVALLPEDSNAYFHRGFAYQELGEVENAKTDYLFAIEQESTNPSLYNNLAILAVNEGDNNIAIEYYDRAIALDPENGLYRTNRELLLSEEESGIVTETSQ